MSFYKCPKCQKVWQYPIEKCPDCFLELQTIDSKEIKVIGVSKVQIPTLFHPKVPYFVLVLEDEKGNKWVQKSVKEYKIGDKFGISGLQNRKTILERGTVAVWRVKYDISETIEKILEYLGGIDVNQDSKILILPTLISAKHPYFAENTNPKFVESVIKYLIEKGVKIEKIKVGAQSFDEIPIEASAQKSQLLDVCLKNKITPLDLAKTNFVRKTESELSFEISEEIFNADLIINLPILKIGKASATENILKCLKQENYLGLKYLYSEKEIIESLNRVLPSYLNLADAQIVQRSNGITTFLGLVLASFNSLNLDRVFAEICLVKDLPEHLKGLKIENIEISGRKIEEVQYEAEKF